MSKDKISSLKVLKLNNQMILEMECLRFCYQYSVSWEHWLIIMKLKIKKNQQLTNSKEASQNWLLVNKKSKRSKENQPSFMKRNWPTWLILLLKSNRLLWNIHPKRTHSNLSSLSNTQSAQISICTRFHRT